MNAATEKPPACRAIRGATTAVANTAEDILEATQEMVTALIRLNDLVVDDVVSAIFTTTPDLTATFPALAAREVGWTEVPLLCSHEMAVPGALTKAVRVLPRQHASFRRPDPARLSQRCPPTPARMGGG